MRHGTRVMLDGVNYLNQKAPVDSGGLLASLQPGAGTTQVNVVGGLAESVTWGSNRPHAGMLDEGARRGPGRRPPAAAIERWLTRKKIATGKQAKGMAFAIAKVIGEKGTQTGPSYVLGRNKGSETKGWFSGLIEIVEQSASRHAETCAREIKAAYDALAR